MKFHRDTCNHSHGKINGENYNHLKNASIGAITVQPYFKIKQSDNSEIDSHGFISKTKAALHYYAKNITGDDNPAINALYYIGDLRSNMYENHEGGIDQKNDAHFVELASVLAILDFAKTDKTALQSDEGKAINPIYKEFGIKEESDQITFVNLFKNSSDLIKNSLSEYFYFNLFIDKSNFKLS